MELAADLTPDGLRGVLAELGERVAPVTFARERTLPVSEPLAPLFPDGGLVRGRVHACGGTGAATVALAMVRDALIAGGWMAIVDVPTFGADAAGELGVPLERVVRVDTAAETSPVGGVDTDVDDERDDADDADAAAVRVRHWFDVMGAAVDGFDVVLVGVPAGLRGDRRPAALRSLLARVQQRGAVVVVLGAAGVVPVDVSFTSTSVWNGLGRGHGVLRRRRLDVVASGRRHPNPTTITVDLDVVGRRLGLRRVDGSPSVLTVVDTDESDSLPLVAG